MMNSILFVLRTFKHVETCSNMNYSQDNRKWISSKILDEIQFRCMKLTNFMLQ
ncbi:hypothetical protein [Perigonia lusca single nucleopolyhedrovirus]|uniref:Uncharacterized protein n=1 Tax=Perigonia lusca single nucleopolyhedrovirus TaxID=1675865 RepID=A0A0M3WNC2_9ABAC|nr:hypothetical protein [Perigonia lusca single nucleopolyhedrovirus]AKN80567.1 hypothetical protein [Perigonia lusca single nucleopolyhedrovirus]